MTDTHSVPGYDTRAVQAWIERNVPGLIDDGHPIGLEPFDGGRHQMADGAHLAGFEFAADLEDDGGPRFPLFALEQLLLRQGQMHAGVLDPVEGADGAGEFAF